MDMFAIIAENKIREAMLKGEFDDLPGQGKPLKIDDLSNVPDDLRASYILLKNAGVLPEEMELHKEIVNLQTLINRCYDDNADDGEIISLRKKLTEKMLRYDMMMEKRKAGSSNAMISYQNKISRKLGRYK
ncbi:DnaJ family domain-containing protein [Sporotomaculum syntrophicum]|nr:DnaJ family domain-containing protein [Sporotomaculum syntrophicum]